MAFNEDATNRDARVGVLIDAANLYHLDRNNAVGIVDHQKAVIGDNWDDVCDAAQLTRRQRDALMGRQFLNKHAFQ